MAKAEFLQNIKTARNLFFHRVQTDHAGLDARTLEGQLARAAIWLTPSSVKGFNDRDFAELSPEIRSRLKEGVERFLQVAKQVPPTKPATSKQLKEAMAALLEVLKIVEPYLPAGAEIEKVREALEGIRFPKNVVDFDYELGADSTGDPAVWVWIFVDDKAAEQESFASMATEIEEKIRNALSAAGVARWPYIHFRTASEQRAL